MTNLTAEQAIDLSGHSHCRDVEALILEGPDFQHCPPSLPLDRIPTDRPIAAVGLIACRDHEPPQYPAVMVTAWTPLTEADLGSEQPS